MRFRHIFSGARRMALTTTPRWKKPWTRHRPWEGHCEVVNKFMKNSVLISYVTLWRFHEKSRKKNSNESSANLRPAFGQVNHLKPPKVDRSGLRKEMKSFFRPEFLNRPGFQEWPLLDRVFLISGGWLIFCQKTYWLDETKLDVGWFSTLIAA